MFFFKKPQHESRKNESSQEHAIPAPLRWVIPQKLAIGSLPTIAHHPRLIAAKIQVIFSLCAAAEGELPTVVKQDFKWIYLPLPDSHYEQLLQVEQLAEAVEILHQCLEANESIYIHCLAGIERSPTVCIAYLCLHKKMELWAALNWLKQIHPRTSPTDMQLKTIHKFMQISHSN